VAVPWGGGERRQGRLSDMRGGCCQSRQLAAPHSRQQAAPRPLPQKRRAQAPWRAVGRLQASRLLACAWHARLAAHAKRLVGGAHCASGCKWRGAAHWGPPNPSWWARGPAGCSPERLDSDLMKFTPAPLPPAPAHVT